jgi:hypothetical protein
MTYSVWLVDDLPANRTKFRVRHKRHFRVTVFKSPDDVRRALSSGKRPNALLCDVYFYDNAKQRENVETEVEKVAQRFDRLATKHHAVDHQTGIELVKDIRNRFNGQPPFPIFSYTAKGPYLLQGGGFKELSDLKVEWLFKNRYDSERESALITRGIQEFRKLHIVAPERIFIVHGHDRPNMLRLKRVCLECWNLKPVILQSKPEKGRTLIEKFEQEARLAAYAIVLLSPDDFVNASRTKAIYAQARPNVIFELGWFYSRLGRERVCLVLKKGTKIPSDLDGIMRIEFSKKVDEKLDDIRKELKEAGVPIKDKS